MSVDHDSNGKFKVGNKAACNRIAPNIKSIKEATKDEVMRCAFSLTQPYLAEDVAKKVDPNNPISKLRYLTDSAVNVRDYAFIKYILEMAIGKPRQAIEVDDKSKPAVYVKRPNGTLVKLGWDDEENKMDVDWRE